MNVGRYGEDDRLLDEVRADGIARLAVTRPAAPIVVLGAGSRPERELLLEAIRADRVPVVRRAGGGCSVVLDPGNVVVSLALAGRGLPGLRTTFDWISQFVIAGLSAIGIPGAGIRGISDLAVGDRKIAGAALFRDREVVYYSVAFLAEPRLELLPRYLQHPPREPDYRRGRAHLDFVQRLVDIDGRWSADWLAASLEARLAPATLLATPFPPTKITL